MDKTPKQIRLKKDKVTLVVVFHDGDEYELPAEYLRVESPSAEVQGHGPDEKKTVPGKRDIQIKDIQAVGRYAVRLVFDDGHDSGTYNWEYLDRLGREYDQRWAAYLDALDQKGLSRT